MRRLQSQRQIHRDGGGAVWQYYVNTEFKTPDVLGREDALGSVRSRIYLILFPQGLIR
jgi:hypothetical protein